MNSLIDEFRKYFQSELNHSINICKKSLIDNFFQGKSIEETDRESISHWFDNIYSQNYLKEIINKNFYNEIIIHDNKYYQTIGKNISNHTIQNLESKDYQLSLEVLTLKNNIAWNTNQPFTSFFSCLFSKSFRVSLCHNSLTSGQTSKLFLRAICPKQLSLENFSCSEQLSSTLKQLVYEKKNMIVCGVTNSGKTTLVKTLLGNIKEDEHLVILEDTHELFLERKNITYLLACPQRNQGLEDCLAYALRMNPHRIILSEVRSREVISFFLAMNAGHRGCLSTLHASSVQEAVSKLALLLCIYNQGGSVNFEHAVNMVCHCIDYIVLLKDKKVIDLFKILGNERTQPIFQSSLENISSI